MLATPCPTDLNVMSGSYAKAFRHSEPDFHGRLYSFHEPENCRLDSEQVTNFRFMVPMRAKIGVEALQELSQPTCTTSCRICDKRLYPKRIVHAAARRAHRAHFQWWTIQGSRHEGWLRGIVSR